MEKIGFDEFSQVVVDKIREFLPASFEHASIELNTVLKNNDLTLHGLTIRSENNIAPTIYMESFYDKYMDGCEMEEVLEMIADTRITHEVEETFDTEQITNFEMVRDMIVPKLVNREWNKELLKNRVHTDIAGDLSVTYQIMLKQDFFGNATVAITNQIMDLWPDVTKEDLHNLAIGNMKRLNQSTFEPMSTVLASMMGDDTSELFDTPENEIMFVISNKSRINGASAILDKDLMTSIVKDMDFILIPSSLHEWLAVKTSDDMDISSIEQMIHEVNETQVAQDEQLSDHPYKYSIEEGLLPI